MRRPDRASGIVLLEQIPQATGICTAWPRWGREDAAGTEVCRADGGPVSKAVATTNATDWTPIGSRFKDMIFIDASSHESIETALAGIAMSKNLGKTYEDTLKWIASRADDCLIIYDNADDPKMELRKYLPRSAEHNVLITTRNQRLVVLTGNADAEHNVSGMNAADAQELLLKTAKLKQDDLSQDEKDALAKLLEVSHLCGWLLIR
jgi:hypothetical protein